MITKKGKKILSKFKAYFSETTVHGFRYIVEGHDVVERTFWAIVIVSGFVLSGILIQQSFENWENTPVQTTIDTVSLPIEQLDFPSITVCNPDSLKMKRRNRWMFLEKLFKWVDTKEPEAPKGKMTVLTLNP